MSGSPSGTPEPGEEHTGNKAKAGTTASFRQDLPGEVGHDLLEDDSKSGAVLAPAFVLV